MFIKVHVENIITWNSKNEWSVIRYESKDPDRIMLIILLLILRVKIHYKIDTISYMFEKTILFSSRSTILHKVDTRGDHCYGRLDERKVVGAINEMSKFQN